MKHFNRGIIFGKVSSATEDKMKDKRNPDRKATCANLQLSCAGDFGRVNVYAKIWQEEAAIKFLAEDNKNKYLRLEGYFAQYESRGQVKSNYNIYRWDPLTTSGQNDQRAVFILVGVVDDIFYDEDGGALIRLTTDRDGYTDTFVLHTLHPEAFTAGETYRVKGELRPTEDRFGDTIVVRPLALDVEHKTESPVPEGAPAEVVPEGDRPF